MTAGSAAALTQVKVTAGRPTQARSTIEAPMLHKRILQWQADHPAITWIFWIVVWAIVFIILFKPARIAGFV